MNTKKAILKMLDRGMIEYDDAIYLLKKASNEERITALIECGLMYELSFSSDGKLIPVWG